MFRRRTKVSNNKDFSVVNMEGYLHVVPFKERWSLHTWIVESIQYGRAVSIERYLSSRSCPVIVSPTQNTQQCGFFCEHSNHLAAPCISTTVPRCGICMRVCRGSNMFSKPASRRLFVRDRRPLCATFETRGCHEVNFAA